LLPIARKVSVAEDIPERIGIGIPGHRRRGGRRPEDSHGCIECQQDDGASVPQHKTETEGWAAKTESELDERFDGERKQEGLKPSRK
jgi:hypothetical protein